MFISTYREQTHRINKVGYGLEMWLRGMVLLVSKPSAHTSLTPCNTFFLFHCDSLCFLNC